MQVDVDTHGDACKLVVDAKANLVSKIRFWFACTPAQAKEALSVLPKAQSEALEEIREENGDGIEETTQQKEKDDREAWRMVWRGYSVIVRVNSVRLEDAETIDQPSVKARFSFA